MPPTLLQEGPSPSFTFQHDFVAGELSYAPGKGRCMSEGLNCKGLSLSLHWNPGAAFSARFDPLGPPAALAVADLGYVALGGFATVQEVCMGWWVGPTTAIFLLRVAAEPQL